MLRDGMALYEQLTGEDANSVNISRLGGFLDGYECGKRESVRTMFGYNIEHLELIARILQKENLPPERVAESLTDIRGIIEMVKNEFEESLKIAIKIQ